MIFADLQEGENFVYQCESFIKISSYRALGLGGGRNFDPDTEVEK
jgi:hypothetical protein